jgi:hypothetical protein
MRAYAAIDAVVGGCATGATPAKLITTGAT